MKYVQDDAKIPIAYQLSYILSCYSNIKIILTFPKDIYWLNSSQPLAKPIWPAQKRTSRSYMSIHSKAVKTHLLSNMASSAPRRNRVTVTFGGVGLPNLGVPYKRVSTSPGAPVIVNHQLSNEEPAATTSQRTY
ncbi:hypothetical protein AVEN_81705-1 [Araneus ventricosus]|uniref:Uncharacterized protein n=1 Tax=Araneus ventricosus TaxID=182803 RepID=A0A4Y2IC20_ARAVE|nr:hypothetical protein AVEN_81705-1 [Araneus ventricosus]